MQYLKKNKRYIFTVIGIIYVLFTAFLCARINYYSSFYERSLAHIKSECEAEIISEICYNKNGDTLMFSYNGYDYALIKHRGDYFLPTHKRNTKPVAKFYAGVHSAYQNYYIYDYQNDKDNLFLYCDYDRDPMVPLEFYDCYRSDITLPELKAENISDIDVFLSDNYDNYGGAVYTIDGNAAINSILALHSENGGKDSIFDNFNYAEKYYSVIVNFPDMPLCFHLGRVNEDGLQVILDLIKADSHSPS